MLAGTTVHGRPYRGRLAPSPTGLLHVGHACTFWTACRRAVESGGILVFRNEDLDPQRSKPEFARAMMDDLKWLGIRWQEGPDVGGPFAPYEQSRRREFYLAAWRRLRDGGFIYPCDCSRKDLLLRALCLSVPAYYHCDLMRDDSGVRLAKRHDALSLRKLREQGLTPQQVLDRCTQRKP
jgi:glutamyl/glutaminyl-tRNA synthetase